MQLILLLSRIFLQPLFHDEQSEYDYMIAAVVVVVVVGALAAAKAVVLLLVAAAAAGVAVGARVVVVVLVGVVAVVAVAVTYNCNDCDLPDLVFRRVSGHGLLCIDFVRKLHCLSF